MPLESADWIPELVETNPIGGDPISQGDDHIRMLKRILKDTFPFADRAVRLPIDHLIHDDLTLDSSHDQQLIRCDTDSNDITVTLPLGSNVWSGYWVLIKKIRTENTLTIAASSGEGINGVPTLVLTEDESWAIVWSSGSTAWTGAAAFAEVTADMIPNDSITNGKLADMAEARVKGRAAGAGTGTPSDLTATQVTALLNTFSTLKGLAPGASATEVADQKFLRANGEWRFAGGAPQGIVVDQKATGAAGGTFTAGAWQTRALNTVRRNVNSFMSLSGNQFTLDGNNSYYIEWRCPAFAVDGHTSRLYSVSQGAEIVAGTPGYSSNSNPSQSWSEGQGTVDVLTSSETFRIEHFAQSTASSNGLGRAANLGGAVESYTHVKIWRV